MQAVETHPQIAWWRRKPTHPRSITLYLLALGILSGLLSVGFSRLVYGSTEWAHFGSGAFLSIVINGFTLSLTHHKEQVALHAAHVPPADTI
jgi:hypothetical protein